MPVIGSTVCITSGQNLIIMSRQSYGYQRGKKGGINKEAGINIYMLLCIKMGFPIGSA